MKGNVLIHGATMVLPNETGAGDLRIRDGVIHAIALGGSLEPMDDELLIDGTGLHLMPGMIAPQVHFRDPGQPEKEDLGFRLCSGRERRHHLVLGHAQQQAFHHQPQRHGIQTQNSL